MLDEKEIVYLESTTKPFRAQWRPADMDSCTQAMSIDDVLEQLSGIDEVEGLHKGKLTEYLTGCGYQMFENMLLLTGR